MATCVLLCSDHAELAAEAEAHARSLFDVRFVGRYPRHRKDVPPELSALLSGQPVDYLFNYLSPITSINTMF